MGWLSREQLVRMGFGELGEDVKVSDRCSIYGAEHVRIGSHVRIDDYAIITAKEPVVIGSYVHISARVYIGGTYGVAVGDFVNLSVGVAVFSSSDDFSGNHLCGPTIPDRFRGPTNGKVTFGKYGGAGANSVILPGVEFGDGGAVGALTLVHRSVEPWTMYLGVPMRRVNRVSTRMRDLARQLLAEADEVVA